MSEFLYTDKVGFVNPGNIGFPTSWVVETVCTPSGPIHDVVSAKSISGQVNIKTLWNTLEELSILIPCITPAEYQKAREFVFSIGAGEFTYDATDQPHLNDIIIVKLKTPKIALPPISARSLYRSARFVVEPVI